MTPELWIALYFILGSIVGVCIVGAVKAGLALWRGDK